MGVQVLSFDLRTCCRKRFRSVDIGSGKGGSGVSISDYLCCCRGCGVVFFSQFLREARAFGHGVHRRNRVARRAAVGKWMKPQNDIRSLPQKKKSFFFFFFLFFSFFFPFFFFFSFLFPCFCFLVPFVVFHLHLFVPLAIVESSTFFKSDGA